MIVSLEVGKLAKEKGYNTPCWDYVDVHGDKSSVMDYIGDTFEEKFYHAGEFVDFYLPTQSFLQKWILEKHSLFVSVELAYNEWGKFSAEIKKLSRDKKTAILAVDGMPIFVNLYNAWNDGLFEALKLIKTENE